jgi:TfoX/Sxy family transcriptional regulator of competence genes
MPKGQPTDPRLRDIQGLLRQLTYRQDTSAITMRQYTRMCVGLLDADEALTERAERAARAAEMKAKVPEAQARARA